MKAAIYYDRQDVRLEQRPDPVCGPGDAVLKTLYSSICGTDVAVYQRGPHTGHKITPGGEFGHETVCEVVQVGENVRGLMVGQRVYPYPLLVTGDTRRAGTIGGFSEYLLAKNVEAGRTVYPVPEEIPTRLACLIEPFTVGCRAARRSEPKPGESAVVFGAGTIGLAAAVTLQWFGAGRVMVCDLSDFRLDIARRLGFLTCNPGREDGNETMRAAFGTAPGLHGPAADVPIWIDAAGADSVLETYMAQGKIVSRFVAVAVGAAARPVDILHLTYAQKSLIGSGGYIPEDVRDVMDIFRSGRWELEQLITHEFPLEDIDAALRTASDTDHALNVTIRFQ